MKISTVPWTINQYGIRKPQLPYGTDFVIIKDNGDGTVIIQEKVNTDQKIYELQLIIDQLLIDSLEGNNV